MSDRAIQIPKGMEREGAKRVGRRRKKRAKTLPVIGWREWLAIPSLDVDRIKAKIDTGARSSSLHAFNIRPFHDQGAPHVAFVICPDQRRTRPAIECTAAILDEREVKSSTGHAQRRYVINVDIALAGATWPIELTLANRDEMGFRMLLGREAVRDRFLVDAGRSYYADRTGPVLRHTIPHQGD